MRIVTDRSPASFVSSAFMWQPLTDDPEPLGALSQVFEACAVLHDTEFADGAFPLVLWRGRALGSQLDLLRRLEPASLPTRLVLVADSGAAFHGHFDRHWAAEPGNLHLACLVREPIPQAKVGMGYAILPSLALADTAATLLGDGPRVQIKWINDILVNGAKVGGTLAVTTAKGPMVETAILGMGLNLDHSPVVDPNPFVPRVGCLADRGSPPDPLDALIILLKHVDRWLDVLQTEGVVPLASHHRRLSAVIGERACLYDDGPGLDDRLIGDRPILTQGVVEEIGDHLQLRIGEQWFNRGRLAFESDLPEGRAPSD